MEGSIVDKLIYMDYAHTHHIKLEIYTVTTNVAKNHVI